MVADHRDLAVVNEHLDDLGPALISIIGRTDRLRMLALLAYVNWTATTSGLKFAWTGAWEFGPMTGTGTVKLGKDGKLKGTFRIRQGDSSTFVAEKTTGTVTGNGNVGGCYPASRRSRESL